LSAKWLPTFADRGCHVVSVTDPYGRILGFIDRSRYFSIKQLLSCTHEAEWTPFQTHYFFFWKCRESNPGLRIWMVAIISQYKYNCFRMKSYACRSCNHKNRLQLVSILTPWNFSSVHWYCLWIFMTSVPKHALSVKRTDEAKKCLTLQTKVLKCSKISRHKNHCKG
jgi:hypothetical protein